jgi:hypothetical protein
VEEEMMALRKNMRGVLGGFGFAVAAALGCSAAVAAPLTITSSLADYEPRLTRPTTSAPGTDLAIDPAVDTPSDALNLRVGGQNRFRIGSAYFFALPTLGPGESISNAHLSFTQIAETATSGANVPAFNADLRVVGITQDIAVANDPDNPQVDPTVNPALSASLYNDAAIDTRPGVGTALPRLLVQDNFLTPQQYIPLGGGIATRSTDAAADALLGGYLTSLYAAGVPANSFLIVTINPDAPPSDVNTNRYQIASANATDAAQGKPTLTLTVVPEPGTVGVLAIAASGLLARWRRKA